MTRSLGGKLNAFEWVLVTTVFALITCVALQAHAAKKMATSLGHGKIVAWFYPEMNKKATLITRTVDCEAGVVVYTANSHTYGYAVATSVIPIKDTLLLYREVCSGTDKNKQ